MRQLRAAAVGVRLQLGGRLGLTPAHCRVRVDELAGVGGVLDHGDGQGMALCRVGIEQNVARLPAADHGELPDQVLDVAHPRAQALAEEGRRLMRRIAGEKRAAAPERVGDRRMEAIDDGAQDLAVVA